MRTRRAVLAGGFLLAVAAAPAAAQTAIECDGFGACYGTVHGRPLTGGFKDGFGNISGRVGTRNFTVHIDPFGNASGRLGERNFAGHVDAFGNAQFRYLDGGGPDGPPPAAPRPPQAGAVRPPAASPPASTAPPRPVWDARPASPSRPPVCYTTRQGRTICSSVP